MGKIMVNRYIPKDFHAAEAIKALRTNLMFCGDDVKAIGLTSFSAGEGKSMISFQLAASFAQTGKRVLLLDVDLRKSVLANRLRVPGAVQGLTHYLSGMANVSELLCQTDVPGLYIMFAGTRIPNAAEALGNKNFKRLIPALKENFDYIIVDAPPIGQVIDCAVPMWDTGKSFAHPRRISYGAESRSALMLRYGQHCC